MHGRSLAYAALLSGLVALVVCAAVFGWASAAPGFDGLPIIAGGLAPMAIVAAVAIAVGVVASRRRARPTWARRVGLTLSIIAALPVAFVLVMVVSLLVSMPRP